MKRIIFSIIMGITLFFIILGTVQTSASSEQFAEKNTSTIESTFDDEFDSATLDPKWHWIREDQTHWFFSDPLGFLVIITQHKDIWEYNKSAPLLLQDLNEYSAGNFEITTRVVMTPTEDYHQGGLIVYEDDNNHIRLTYGFREQINIEFAKEVNGSYTNMLLPVEVGINDFHLKIRKTNTTYYGFYSIDAKNWIEVGEWSEVPIDPYAVGITAFNGSGSYTEVEIPAKFDYFKLEEINTLLDCTESKVYYGITHCKDINDDAQLIVVDLNDPHVSVRTALSSRNGVECNSVNHNGTGKDPTSNCDPLYPVETVENMLIRYREQEPYRNVRPGKEAVAIINTDYFALDHDHGAQGLAVRDGIRLDGDAHNDDDDGYYRGSTKPSLSISDSMIAMIGTPKTEQETIEDAEQKINLFADTVYSNTVGGAPIIISNTIAIGNDACSSTEYPFLTCHQEQQSAAGLTNDGQLVLITAKKDASGVAEYLTEEYGTIFEGSQVHTALKFDGSDSASMAWVGSNGNVVPYYTGNKRDVAEGLLIFSSRICPVEDTLEQNEYASEQLYPSNVSDLISQYRQLRDEVLQASVVGKRYIEDYYIYGPEVSQIILADSDLRTRTAQFLENAAPAFGSLLPNSNEDVVLTKTLYDQAEALVYDLASAGSQKLSNVIIQTWEYLALDEHIGEAATEIWQDMQEYTIYLPMIEE